MMGIDPVNTPSPHELETRVSFLDRYAKHPTVMRLYSSAIKRRTAGERRWLKAKADSQISIKTEAGEMLLFAR